MGKRQSFQQVTLGNLNSCMQISESRTHPHTIHENKWLKDLNIRQDTIKLLEENTGKTFSDINLTNVFSGQSPKATEIKAKINQWDLIELTSFCTAKETIKTKQNKNTTYRMGENSFKQCNRQGLNL